MFNIRTALVATTLLLGDGAVVIAADATTVMELVMIEQPGCQWCARWNAEIAPIYPKTPEAAQAPCGASTFMGRCRMTLPCRGQRYSHRPSC